MVKRNDDQRRDFVRCNEQIRIPQVLVIHNGVKMGVMPTRKALEAARELGLDLVEVSPTARPPVCSIMDYGKYMFDKQKKEKNKSHQPKEKEISFRYVIDIHDLQTKANQAKKFLAKGNKVKLMVKFKQREKAHKDQGFTSIKKLIDLIGEDCLVEKAPAFEGNNIIAKLSPKKALESDS